MAKGPTPTPSTRVENVADALRERILTGAWQPHTQLPTEQQLAQQQGVSRATIRAAISMLVEQICRLREPQYLALARGLTKRG